ncbi:MAG: hypothetical protein JWM59_673 [Verrucomicrobiales bacterium]|nr:hypothetical protein [Verrucomicrobiales bacterium]
MKAGKFTSPAAARIDLARMPLEFAASDAVDCMNGSWESFREVPSGLILQLTAKRLQPLFLILFLPSLFGVLIMILPC